MNAVINKIPNRVVVYPKDIENITGRKERAARKLLQNIKKAFSKRNDQFVTVYEFSLYTGIDEGVVRDYL
ncbi:MAG: hypothetical protein HY252_16700 [Sphingobacteriales bacterium]|nr:hypothetical protein [Sphingobacteriales bacterium]